MTPEGKVKAHIKRVIAKFGKRVYSHWPVLNGMGEPTLDCNGAAAGCAYSIEAKAPGEKPTPRQCKTIRTMMAAGMTVFVLIGDDAFTFAEFEQWLTDKVGEPDVR